MEDIYKILMTSDVSASLITDKRHRLLPGAANQMPNLHPTGFFSIDISQQENIMGFGRENFVLVLITIILFVKFEVFCREERESGAGV